MPWVHMLPCPRPRGRNLPSLSGLLADPTAGTAILAASSIGHRWMATETAGKAIVRAHGPSLTRNDSQ
jgi:hypothetical protein